MRRRSSLDSSLFVFQDEDARLSTLSCHTWRVFGGEGVLLLVDQVKAKYQVQEKSGKRDERCDERGEITSTIDVKPVCHAKYNVPCRASSGLHVLAINSIASRTPYAAQHWHSGTASGAVLGAVCTSKFACNFMSLSNVLVAVIQSDIAINTDTARCPIENLLCA
jgi:hypothetical protein